ncbi:hypothetical protein [Amorphus sp. 3PC139-8]|uniref:hypothetical protein n=1 Tax=Amorphus sp. 3PC139-8 TaxID=2735676 RepID=UPI00345D6E93
MTMAMTAMLLLDLDDPALRRAFQAGGAAERGRGVGGERSPAHGQGVAPFTPGALFGPSDPGGWYDPSDISTLWRDTSGTVPVTAAGHTVGLYLDKRLYAGRSTAEMTALYGSVASIPGNHRTQATSGFRPAYDTTSLPTPTLNHDGTDDYMYGPLPIPPSIAMTHFWVVNVRTGRVAWNNARSLVTHVGNSGDGSASIVGYSSGSIYRNNNGVPLATRGDVYTAMIGTNYGIVEARGLVHASAATTMDFGYRASFLTGIAANIAEEIYCREDVAAAYRAKIYAYLAEKWGVTI